MLAHVLRVAVGLTLALLAGFGVGAALGLPLLGPVQGFEPPLLRIAKAIVPHLPLLGVLALTAVMAAEARAWRSIGFWLGAGAAIAAAGYFALRAGSADMHAALGGRAPLDAFISGLAGGLVYWMVAGRRSGDLAAEAGRLFGPAPLNEREERERCALCTLVVLGLGLLPLGVLGWYATHRITPALWERIVANAEADAERRLWEGHQPNLRMRIDGHIGRITGTVADVPARNVAFVDAQKALAPIVGVPGVVAALQNDIAVTDDSDPRVAAENARIKAAHEEAQRAAEAAAKKKAEDERLAAEAEAKRKAEEEAAAKKKAEDERLAAEAEAKRKAEEEAAAKKKAEDERLAAEAEARRKAEEEAAAKKKAEDERLAAEAEAKRKAEDEAAAKKKAEDERLAAEAEAKRKAEEEAAAKKKAEDERLAAEAEAKRKAEDEAAAKKKAEDERLAAEAEAKRKAEEEAAAKKKAEDERLAAEAEAKRKAEEEAAAKKKAEDERLAAEAEAKRKSEEEAAAKKKAEDERLAAEAEAKRKAEDEAAAAKKKAEDERLAAEAEAKRKADEEAAAKKRAEDETRRAAHAKFEACSADFAKLTAGRSIRFRSNASDLRRLQAGFLDAIAEIAKRCDGMMIVVQGHADGEGSEAYNQVLSDDRAEAVRAALVERGVDANNLEARGFSFRSAANGAMQVYAIAANRRVDFSVLEREKPAAP